MVMFVIAATVLDKPSSGLPANTYFESMATLARDCCKPMKATRQIVRRLEARGVVKLVAKGGGRRRFGQRVGGVHNTWETHPDWLPKADAVRRASSRAMPAAADLNPGQNRLGIHGEPGSKPPGYAPEPGSKPPGLYEYLRAKSSEDLREPIGVAPAGATTPVVSDLGESVRRCLAAFSRCYYQRFGERPLIVKGKDARLLTELLRAWGDADVLAMIEAFFATSNPRIQGSDYTVGAFSAFAQRLRLDMLGAVVDERTAHNVDAAARATQRRI